MSMRESSSVNVRSASARPASTPDDRTTTSAVADADSRNQRFGRDVAGADVLGERRSQERIEIRCVIDGHRCERRAMLGTDDAWSA